jgi:integrase
MRSIPLSNVNSSERSSLASAKSLGPKPKYLHKRGGTYYFKRKIPADVAHGFPDYRGQLWKSLSTKLFHQARVYLAVEVTEFELKVAQLRKELANDWAVASGCLRSDQLVHVFRQPPSGQRPASFAESVTGVTADIGVSSVTVVSSRSDRTVDAASGGNPGRRVPTAQVQQAPPRAETSNGAAAAKRTAPRTSHGAELQLSAQPRQPIAGAAIVTMLHLFEDWKLKQTRPRTVAAVHNVVMDFRTLHGPLAVPDISKAHVRAYRDVLIERRLSKGTIENRIGFLSTLVRHGMRELVEDLVRNPFERIDVVGAQGLRAPKDRRAFSVKELNSLFASRLYTQGYRPDGQAIDAAYWVPLLGPFVGARIEELCQLRLDDIQRINGVWCIRICDLDEEQNVKTESSFRRVPLHDAVIRSGFLVYAARMASAGHERLFPTLSNHNANRIYSNAVGKWFGRYLETIGLGDSRLDYHSFRYSFKQQCSLCGLSDEVRDALSGHWVGAKDAGRAYLRGENRQYSYPKLIEGIRQLSYDELQMDHLFVGSPMQGVDVLLE